MKNRRTFMKQAGTLTLLSPLAAASCTRRKPEPAAEALPFPQTIPAEKDGEPLGFKPHPIRVGDGKGGWQLHWGEVQLLRFGGDINKNRLCPFGLAQMDNGEVAMVAVIGHGSGVKVERPVIGFSRDGGATWSDLKLIGENIMGRPMMLDYLGDGVLTFQAGWSEGSKQVGYRFFSKDYGRTWPERVPLPVMPNGYPFPNEGNALVERDARGLATRVVSFAWVEPPNVKHPVDAFIGGVVRSSDGGRTWSEPLKPKEWTWEEEYKGKRYLRGVSEGSLVRAANGSIVAALRTDMPPRYFGHRNDDSLEGTAVSISKDDGKTWSPLKMVFEPGRHHAHLLRMPNNDLVMTVIVRDDVQNGKLASYRRGCDAVVSHDNGLTWETGRRYVLDEFEYYDNDKWFNGETGHLYSALLNDGNILTTYGNYATKSAVLIRWKPIARF